MKSIFAEKTLTPTSSELEKALGATFPIWQELENFTTKTAPFTLAEWNYSGEKFGWSYRIKDKKRVLIYLLPRDGYFKAAFVFGQKAMDKIMGSTVSEAIKNELQAAKSYAEGRGIRIDVKGHSGFEDLLRLIEIKIGN
ncbi:DUF3788 domain-containing protein [Chryseobacterium sp.]|uniref:DUF3788 domain-containing protein n=1 Tax=Chryseobacterium sp. TaxID=1871047 RepID=UPI00162999DF|nr:DUF3788 domain-containing protein [Chryseobacterium sp.]